jgi:hypothetical protein
MEEDDRNHEVGSPAMERANKPAKLDPVVENLKAVPCLACGRHVNQRKENSSTNLENKNDKSGAAENIEPTRRIARNGVLRGFAQRLSDLEARIQPITDLPDQTHRRVSKVTSDD